MNVELLRKIENHILEEPKRLFMPAFVRRQSRGDVLLPLNSRGTRDYPECGTAACIAGWAVFLSEDDSTLRTAGEIMARAMTLLQIGEYSAHRLFLAQEWPLRFWKGGTGDGEPETAQMTAARIEHFIDTGGRE
jgi:hypothetical protein